MRFWMLIFAMIMTACDHSDGPKQAPKKIENPPLFEITPPGGGPKSYLLGSLHMGIGIEEFPQRMIQLHDNAQVHAYEMNVAYEMDLVAQFATNPEYAVRKIHEIQKKKNPQIDLGRLLTASEQAPFAAIGIPPGIVRNLRSSSSCKFVQAKSALFDRPFHSMDNELLKKTLSSGRSLLELDTEKLRDDADKYAKSLGYQDEDDCTIQKLVDNPSKIYDYLNVIDKMTERYRYKITPQAVMSAPADTSPATSYRNKAWIPKLVPVLKTKSTFITVGLFHLVGPSGLIQLLRDQGFQVEPKELK